MAPSSGSQSNIPGSIPTPLSRLLSTWSKDLWLRLHNVLDYQTLPRDLGAKIAMQYFRFLPDSAKLRKEARWSGVSSVPGIGERVQSSADVGAGTVTAYFVDNGRLEVLVRLELPEP